MTSEAEATAPSRGRIAVVHTAELPGRAREACEEDGCESDLNIPISVYGTRVGSIGFAGYLVGRFWSHKDISGLEGDDCGFTSDEWVGQTLRAAHEQAVLWVDDHPIDQEPATEPARCRGIVTLCRAWENAMHIPDGLIGPGVSAAAGVVATGGFGVAVSRARRYLTDRLVPLAALVTAFVFAAQMINFPVLPGMSGHLLGGVLAAVLVGPWAGYLVISIVLIIQAFLFADGGLTALGLNIVNMALIGGVVGYGMYRVIFRFSGSRPDRVAVAAGVAALLSVPLAGLGFVVEFALGGTAESLSIWAVLVAMLGTHLLIGIGEGVITFFVVGAVMKARPDLVYGAPTFSGRRTEELLL